MQPKFYFIEIHSVSEAEKAFAYFKMMGGTVSSYEESIAYKIHEVVEDTSNPTFVLYHCVNKKIRITRFPLPFFEQNEGKQLYLG